MASSNADQGGDGAAASGDAALRPAKRLAAAGFQTQSPYPELEPRIKSSTWDCWNPVPGTLVETETEITYSMLTPADRWVRFAENPFYIEYEATYKNPVYNAAAEAGRGRVEHPTCMALDRFPPCFLDTELGVYPSLFARMDFLIDGVPVTNRGLVPLGDHQPLYQKLTRSFLGKGERAAYCDSRLRVRSTDDIKEEDATKLSEAYKSGAALLHFDNYEGRDVHAMKVATSGDGLWPLSGRRDPLLNKLFNRSAQRSNPMIRPKTLLEARFVKHVPSGVLVQTDGARLTDAVALSGTAAAGNHTAIEVTLKLKKMSLLYELLELEDHSKMMMLKELKYYHDRPSVSVHTMTAGVDAAVHNIPVERGTLLLLVTFAYSHQVYYNAGQRKGRVMRFPPLRNLKSVRFQIGETPIFSTAPVDGLQNTRTSQTAASHMMYAYLKRRRLCDDPFEVFRPHGADKLYYAGGIYPIDLTAHDSAHTEGDLKLTLAFEGAESPANAVIVVAAVTESVWRCEVSSKKWTLETVHNGSGAGGNGGGNKRAKH